MPKTEGAVERWTYGAYYLDRPHPERGGAWYACRYDAGTRTVHRRSLRTTDFEQAKQKLVSLAAVTPVSPDTAPHPRDVMTTAILDAYTSGHGQTIASEPFVIRAGVLVVEYLKSHATLGAPVSFWTPARQADFGRYLHETHGHVPATIHRYLAVLNAAFRAAVKSQLRPDALGTMVEGALMSHAPPFAYTQAGMAKELRIADPRPPTFCPTLEEMARFIDALDAEHLRRWVVIALATWARPQAVTDFDPDRQLDRRSQLLDLNPPGRVQTTKRRSKIVCCQTLGACIDLWRQENAVTHERLARRYRDSGYERSDALLVYKGRKVGTVKKAVKRIADSVGLPKITQRTTRTFMNTMVRKLCRGISREQRSLWLAHSVREGSRTTTHYDIDDAESPADVALATDYVLQRLRSLCTKEFAVEVLLKPSDLRRIGARITTISRGK